MDRESVERLRYDIRLKRRREWLSPEDRSSYLESLPDLTDKMTRGFDDDAREEDRPKETPAAAPAFSPPPAAAGSAPTTGSGGVSTPIPFGSSAAPSSSFPSDGGDDGGSGPS